MNWSFLFIELLRSDLDYSQEQSARVLFCGIVYFLALSHHIESFFRFCFVLAWTKWIHLISKWCSTCCFVQFFSSIDVILMDNKKKKTIYNSRSWQIRNACVYREKQEVLYHLDPLDLLPFRNTHCSFERQVAEFRMLFYMAF